jgi:hypothetical protein
VSAHIASPALMVATRLRASAIISASPVSLPKTQSATKSGLFMQSVEGPKDLLNGRPLHI